MYTSYLIGSLCLAVVSALTGASGSMLTPFGTPISLPWPNDYLIQGLSGLTYDAQTDIWTAVAETIRGNPVTEEYPFLQVPRLYRFKLDFVEGTFACEEPCYVTLKPGTGLKLEGITLNPDGSFWVCSEANSDYVPTQALLSGEFIPNLNTIDIPTVSDSRLLRVSAQDGAILEEVSSQPYTKWDRIYSWESGDCKGERIFQGLHGMSSVTRAAADGSRTLIVGRQAALSQDGPSPTLFDDSPTRLFFYKLDNGTGTSSETAQYSRSYRYDVSHLTHESFQKGATHFNALFGILALSETSLLMAENEDFTAFGETYVVNRIFHVELDPDKTVDHCTSLLKCNISAPQKRLVLERRAHFEEHWDGFTWGPDITVGGETYPSVAAVFEKDHHSGARFELYLFNGSAVSEVIYPTATGREHLRKQRSLTVLAGSSIAAVIIALQVIGFWIWYQRRNAAFGSLNILPRRGRWTFSHYLLATSIMNSFLVGGFTFGFSGMVLILRKENVFAEMCQCGTFCSGQKEQLALVSSLGFSASIGARIVFGYALDTYGPKITAMLSCALSFVGCIMLAAADDADSIGSLLLPAWLLMCMGCCGLHVTGYHVLSLFSGHAKMIASACISTAFGAASLILPLMQLMNQYADVPLQGLMIFYACIVLLVGIHNFLVQPWEKLSAGVLAKPDLRLFRRQWWQRDVRWKPQLRSALKDMKGPDFWGEALFFSANMLVATFYLSSVADMMYNKGDLAFSTNANDWADYMFTKCAGIFNGLGFVWFPLVEYTMYRFEWSTCFAFQLAAHVVFVVLLLMPQLEVQMITFLLQGMVRLMIFTYHHTYLVDRFGLEHFGILNGVTSLVAGVFGLLGYPLQLFAVYILRGDFVYTLALLSILLLLSAAFPLYLRRMKMSNWAQTSYVDPLKFSYPGTVTEVVRLVKGATKLRCAGAMHSCAPLIESESVILSLKRLDKILEIDVEKQRVRFQAGVTIHQLCEVLAEKGLAVGTLGTIDWQTVVGAAMTGTHGGGLTIPSLHAFMIAYKLVAADGSIHEIRWHEDPHTFSAMAPSMGIMGVAVEAEMQLVPLQYLEAGLIAIPFEELAGKFKDVARSNKYARVVVYPTIGQATIWTANPVEKGVAIKRGATECNGYMNFRDEYEKAWLEEWVRLSQLGKYDAADRLLQRTLDSQLVRLKHYEGQYNHVLCKERNHGIPHADMELGFGFEQAEEVLTTIFEFCKTDRPPYYNFEVRCTRQDDAMLSVCHDRDTMWIDFQAKVPAHKDYFGKMEDLFEKMNYRKHWAKGMDHTNPEYIMRNYPKLAEFLEIESKFDPHSKFTNDHVMLWLNPLRQLTESSSGC